MKTIAMIVNMKPKRVWDMITYYIDKGCFPRSNACKAIDRTPVEFIDVATSQSVLQSQGGMTIDERCLDL